MENSKKDTSLLGSQLQEVYVRNEKLSKTINERNSAFLKIMEKNKNLESHLDELNREKKSIKVQKDEL